METGTQHQHLFVSVYLFLSHKQDMKFKTISKNAFVLLSLLFVIERSFRCIEKFIEKPQAVEIKMSDGVDEMLPHFTFCAEEKYNQTLVEECGFEL